MLVCMANAGIRLSLIAPFIAMFFSPLLPSVSAQEANTQLALAESSSSLPDAPLPLEGTQADATTQQPQSTPYQTKRILGVIPNFRSVSADAKLPPQTDKQKLLTGLQDSFDYSSFIFAGAQAGVSDATRATPQFGHGAVAYGRYYWHTLADQADENLWVESFIPIVTHEDSRYYTLGHGSILKRAGYSLSRAFITKKDSGGETFNASEVFGAGAAAGISYLYYPSADKTLTKTYQRWITSIVIDGATFTFKEFWPDINRAIFHQTAD